MKKVGTIAVLTLEGVISGGSGSNNINPMDVFNSIEKIKKMKRIDGCIVRINSPGGSAPASEEITHMIRTGIKIPTFASIADMACSGGYMIATACDKIFANYSSFVGSIGVIMNIPQIQDIMKKVEYSEILLKAGKFKDICSTKRDMTHDEELMLLSLIDSTYSNFRSIVQKNRELTDNEIIEISEGKIFIGETAVKNKMIDFIGGYNVCLASMKLYLSLDSFKTVEINKTSRWTKLLSKLSFGEIINQFDFNSRMKDFILK